MSTWHSLCLCILVALLAAAPALPAAVTTQYPLVTVNCANLHQEIDGFGACLSHHQQVLQQLFNTDHEFQDLLLNDLGLTIARSALPPALQAGEDLDTNSLVLTNFNFATIGSAIALTSLYHRSGGRVKIIFSIWSPPPWMKTSNVTTNGGNLRVDRRAHFAKYCAGAMIGFSNYWGAPVYAFSPQNEPLFVEPYDSCVYSYSAYFDMFKELVAAMQRWGVTSKVYGPEDMGLAFSRVRSYLTPILTNNITRPYLNMCATHGYTDDGISPGGASPQSAEQLRTWLAPYAKGSWMSETSGEYPAWTNGYYTSPGTEAHGALSLAWKIHVGLVHGDQNAFVYWTVGEAQPSGFGLLAYKTPTCKYYAAKHFYRWIRPQARRVDATPTTNTFGVGAFIHQTNQTLTLTFVSLATTSTRVNVHLTNVPWRISAFETYRSSVNENCVKLPNTWVTNDLLQLVVPAESVMTLYSGVPTNAVPFVAPAALDFGTNGVALPVSVRNDGLTPCAYSASVVAGAPWLSVMPTNGVLSNQVVRLTAAVQFGALPRGTHTATILITASTGTNILVPVRLAVIPTNAVPTAWPVRLDFTTLYESLSINLGNEGMAAYAFSASVVSGAEWLAVAPGTGIVSAPQSVFATATRGGLPFGESFGHIEIAAAHTNLAITARITSDVPEGWSMLVPLLLLALHMRVRITKS